MAVSIEVAYGPVPSRRLGRSLGINNVPPKRCSYSCIYCQLGLTAERQVRRTAGYGPAELFRQVREKALRVREQGEHIDYLAFVPDGEPTLDINLGKEIDLLRTLGIKIAVITNASLLGDGTVREDLQRVDWVCLKVDAVTPDIWKRVNRPHYSLEVSTILDGVSRFAATFSGELVSETMLIRGVNDGEREIGKIADFLALLGLAVSYISVPTRPPAEPIEPADEQSLNMAYQAFSKKLKRVEYLIGYEGNDFATTGNAVDDLLSITAVHPMREDAVQKLLERLDVGWDTVSGMIDNGILMSLEYHDKTFYARKLPVLKNKRGDTET